MFEAHRICFVNEPVSCAGPSISLKCRRTAVFAEKSTASTFEKGVVIDRALLAITKVNIAGGKWYPAVTIKACTLQREGMVDMGLTSKGTNEDYHRPPEPRYY